MRILVTGGCGFVGSHICDALLREGHSVTVVDNLSTGSLDKSVEFVELDVRSAQLGAIFDRLKPDAVFHEAAQISVSRSVSDPAHDADVNIAGTINVLECCKKARSKLIFASSAAVYGTPEYLGVDERHPARPMSPYGLSKLAAEGYIRLYSELFGLDYTILRYANVYGPRQSASGEGGVVAIFAGKARSGETPVIFGDGQHSRDFINVHDIAAANICALTRGSRETINIGTGNPVTIAELCALMCEKPPRFEPERPGDIRHSYFNIGKMRSTLGFTPQTSLKDGLAELLK